MADEAFAALFEAASAARAHAHVPYSHFPVGAAIRTPDGRIHAGCNVENAAYPQSQCAEATAIGVMVAAGGRAIEEIVVIGGETGDTLLCTPCGGCRQRIREFATAETRIHACDGSGVRHTFTCDELLPKSFGPEHLS